MTHPRQEHQNQKKSPMNQQRDADAKLREQANAQAFDTDRTYWLERYNKEPYYEAGRPFSDYEPGYRAGYDGHTRYGGHRFEDVEPKMKADYENLKADMKLGWDKARKAALAAWHRIEDAMPGDADNDRH